MPAIERGGARELERQRARGVEGEGAIMGEGRARRKGRGGGGLPPIHTCDLLQFRKDGVNERRSVFVSC